MIFWDWNLETFIDLHSPMSWKSIPWAKLSAPLLYYFYLPEEEGFIIAITKLYICYFAGSSSRASSTVQMYHKFYLMCVFTFHIRSNKFGHLLSTTIIKTPTEWFMNFRC